MSYLHDIPADRVSVAPGRHAEIPASMAPYTFQAASQFGLQFRILPSYLSKVEHQMASPRRSGFSADILFLGTGISEVPRFLARTRGGVIYTAITAALMTSFQSNYSARAIAHMLRTYHPEISMVPSAPEIEALSNELSSAVRDKNLGGVIWGIERLVHSPQRDVSNLPRLPDPLFPAPPLAEDLSVVIYSLATLSRGQQAVIRSSQASLSWIAAFAHIVLGLSVTFQMGSRILWERQANSERGSVHLIYAALETEHGVPGLVKVECVLKRAERDENTMMKLPIRDCASFILCQFSPEVEVHSFFQKYVTNIILLFLESEVYPIKKDHEPIPIKKFQMLPFGSTDAHRALKEMFGASFQFARHEARSGNLVFGSDFRTPSKSLLNSLYGYSDEKREDEVICTLQSLIVLWTACLVLDTSGEVQLEGNALLMLLRNHDQIFRKIWISPPRRPHGLLYEGLLQQMFSLFGGPLDYPSSEDFLAICSSGTYLALGPVIDADLNLRGTLRFVAGPGGIFVNESAVPMLLSFNQKRGETPDIVDDQEFSHYIKQYQVPIKDLVLADDTQLSLRQRIYAREGRDGTEIAHYIYARNGPDMVLEVFITPLEIVAAELAILNPDMNTDGSQARQTPQHPHVVFEAVAVDNVEAYLKEQWHTYSPPRNSKKKAVIMCHGNSAARVLATCLGPPGKKIKQPPGASLVHWASLLGDSERLIVA